MLLLTVVASHGRAAKMSMSEMAFNAIFEGLAQTTNGAIALHHHRPKGGGTPIALKVAGPGWICINIDPLDSI